MLGSSQPVTGLTRGRMIQRVAFEADLPRIEGTCNRQTGEGCTLIPTTDGGTPAAFYPYYSAFQGTRNAGGGGHGCMWELGGKLPGATTDFGKNNHYGSQLTTTYLAFGGGGSTINRINNFRQIIANPCPR